VAEGSAAEGSEEEEGSARWEVVRLAHCRKMPIATPPSPLPFPWSTVRMTNEDIGQAGR